MLITVAGIGFFMFFGQLLCRSLFRSGGRFKGRGKSSGKGYALILAIGIACLVFGYLLAPILRFALSRRREYQADATAVRTTRDPEALVSALLKIAADPRVEILDTSPLAGNMCIANPAKLGFADKLYSTHPPIEDRIAVLSKLTVRGKQLYANMDDDGNV
jgi:heat shock protein HtpX